MTGSPADLYRALGVAPTATTEEITVAFRARAKEMHPDRTTGDDATAERFKVLTHAYSVLVRPDRRAAYDRRRDATRRVPAPTSPPRARGHEPLFRTPRRARAAIWSGIGLLIVGLLGMGVLANVSTGDSGKAITLWLVVVKLIACGAILWAVGWWRLRRLQAAGTP
jgi:predicted lipid-binding transport protein (Tim44 family)